MATTEAGGGDMERRPLLRRSSTGRNTVETADNVSLKEHTNFSIYIVVLLLAIFAMFLGESFQEPAFGEIEEGIFCREYFSNVTDTANDPRCKDQRIQSNISMLEAVEATIRFAVSLLTGIPYGIVAERFGRRRVLVVSMIGMALRYPLDLIVCAYFQIKLFPIRFYWLVALVTGLGGGITVFMAIVYTILSDISTQTQRYAATVYFYVSAIFAGTPIIGNPLAYLAMKRGPWFSSYISIACNLVAVLLTLQIPETKHVASSQNGGLENDNSAETENSSSQNNETLPTLSKANILSSARDGIISLRGIIWDNKRLSTVLCSTLFTRLGSYTHALLMQYIANLVITLRFLSKLILVLFVLPVASHLLLRAHVSPLAKDLLLARCCIVITAVGAFGIASAATPAVLVVFLVPFAFLEGFNATVKSFLAQLAGGDRTAIVFTAVGVLENVGVLLAGPAIAGTFSVGLRWGEQWYGLPFAVAGAMFSVAAVMVLSIRIYSEDAAERE
ncbi:MFS transporter [Pochonia chlamydosporia 170]|uniref:MFS transporter n=1 Tax=Pochonia chlamydosporia 170 TaxID=1380566 RepID=A0A179F112_METCM|nr:MFS transporter [Pochonia chlamydosporia 170]OAQ59144.2 MFS transporter [Pochonia chlamydosporia 170]